MEINNDVIFDFREDMVTTLKKEYGFFENNGTETAGTVEVNRRKRRRHGAR